MKNDLPAWAAGVVGVSLVLLVSLMGGWFALLFSIIAIAIAAAYTFWVTRSLIHAQASGQQGLSVAGAEIWIGIGLLVAILTLSLWGNAWGESKDDPKKREETEEASWRMIKPAEMHDLVQGFWVNNARTYGWGKHLPMPEVDGSGVPRRELHFVSKQDLTQPLAERRHLPVDLTFIEPGVRLKVAFPERSSLIYDTALQFGPHDPVHTLDNKPSTLASFISDGSEGQITLAVSKDRPTRGKNFLKFPFTFSYRPKEVWLATERFVPADSSDSVLRWGKLPNPKQYSYDVYVRLYDQYWRPVDTGEAKTLGKVLVFSPDPAVGNYLEDAFASSVVTCSSMELTVLEDETCYLGITLPTWPDKKPAMNVVVSLRIRRVKVEEEKPST